MQLKPKWDIVVLKPMDGQEIKHGKIIIPASVKSQSAGMFRVEAIGPGKLNADGVRIPTTIQVGEVVIVQKNAKIEVGVNGESHYLTREADCLCGVEI